eukprot:scaffold43204_cov95-Phaeocystis_antarctica.AAC.1
MKSKLSKSRDNPGKYRTLEASCGHTRRGIASSSCTGVRPRPQAIPECSRLKRALLQVAAERRRSVRARTLGLLLLLRAFRPSGRSEKGCERLGHVDEASAGLTNAGDWRTEAVDRGRAVGGLNAAVCRRGSRPTAHPRESCGD